MSDDFVFVENEDALFRCKDATATNGWRYSPMEIWDFAKGAWKPFAQAGVPKPSCWGQELTEEQFEKLRDELEPTYRGEEAPGREGLS